ncbi:hypothetical protein [Aridibaculum aurantiacum]|uniref:hypothetical protein n=1 Tax=Aridibaculum aurantiacum TaxID=2810307 RepID=UPI001A9764CC|nr:hypothetical protein [Aridibaculum aurantiacum]
MKEILKDYGTLVGSFLGFTFAVLAMYIKYIFDWKTSKWTTDRKLIELRRLIKHSGFTTTPIYVHNNKSTSHMLQFPNVPIVTVNPTPIKYYIRKVDKVLSFMGKIEDDVLKFPSHKTIDYFYDLKLLGTHVRNGLSQLLKDKEMIESSNEQIQRLDAEEIFETYYRSATELYFSCTDFMANVDNRA